MDVGAALYIGIKRLYGDSMILLHVTLVSQNILRKFDQYSVCR